jgi:6-phosphogluconolactonase (cycloisomerase 2 family)
VSGSAATTQTAACWAAVTPDGRYAYVTNAGSGSITGYRVAFDGSLRRLDASGRTAVTGTGSTPLDMVVTDSGRMLYVLTGGSHAITPFRIGRDGSLTPLPGGATVPAGVNGLAVR